MLQAHSFAWCTIELKDIDGLLATYPVILRLLRIRVDFTIKEIDKEGVRLNFTGIQNLMDSLSAIHGQRGKTIIAPFICQTPLL